MKRHLTTLISFAVLAVLAVIFALAGAAFAQDNMGHLVIKDANDKPIRAIFRPSEAHASNDLMTFEDRCIEVFDLDGDHLHWAPYDLHRGTIAYGTGNPCLPPAPVFWFNDACTLALVERGDSVAFYNVADTTLSRSSASSDYTVVTAYSMKTGVCAPVSWVGGRTFSSIRPMSDTVPWPSRLPGQSPFHIEVVYD